MIVNTLRLITRIVIVRYCVYFAMIPIDTYKAYIHRAMFILTQVLAYRPLCAQHSQHGLVKVEKTSALFIDWLMLGSLSLFVDGLRVENLHHQMCRNLL